MKQLIDWTLYAVGYSPAPFSPPGFELLIKSQLTVQWPWIAFLCWGKLPDLRLSRAQAQNWKGAPFCLWNFIGKLLEEETPKIRVGLWSTNCKDLFETKGHIYGGTKAGLENTFLKLEVEGWGSVKCPAWSPAWFFSHWPNSFKIYHSLSWIVNSLMNQHSHSFGNNTHSVENKDIFFFFLF